MIVATESIERIYGLFRRSSGVSTDSRELRANSLFFALRGERFDGNRFALKALEEGALAAVVSDPEIARKDKRCLYVPDTTETLAALAHFHRMRLAIPLILITGTNGKTTTKELVATVLSRRYETLATRGNLNNHIGVPLTLLSLRETHQVAVIEAGASHEGEISLLARIAAPQYGIITNIGKAHLEGFGSFEGVVRAKTELYGYLREHGGKVFLHGTDDLLMHHAEGIPQIRYGTSGNVMVKGALLSSPQDLRMAFRLVVEGRSLDVSTKLVGNYNLPNALAAAAVGVTFGIPLQDIADSIASYEPQNHRSQLIGPTPSGNLVIADVYNANPSSMQVAISNFFSSKSSRNRLLILGDMLELGDNEAEEHQTLLEALDRYRKESSFTSIFVGDSFKALEKKYSSEGSLFFQNVKALETYLEKYPLRNTFILLKASHGVHLEYLIPLL